MSELARSDDLDLLGVSAGAPAGEVSRAHRELKALYAEDSLAAYSLFSPEERTAWLERIEEAHVRVGSCAAASPAPVVESAPATPKAPVVNPAESPGVFLRCCREAKGLTLQDVAEETKISRRHLENIERENFGQLPVRVYLRGFLVAYAQALKLESPKGTADLYLNKYEAELAQVA